MITKTPIFYTFSLRQVARTQDYKYFMRGVICNNLQVITGFQRGGRVKMFEFCKRIIKFKLNELRFSSLPYLEL